MGSSIEAEGGGVLRVLLMGRSEDDAALVVTALRLGGYEPVCRHVQDEGEFARALAASDFDVVIAEHSASTLAALGACEREGRDIPFIILSETANETLAVMAIKAGAHELVRKDHLTRLPIAVERELREAAMRAEQRSMREQLVVSERLAMAGRLAGGVAHEINNPLAVILANLDFVASQITQLARENTRYADANEALRDARGAADTIRDIVRDLRLFSNPKGDARTPVDLQRIVESSIRLAYSEIRHRARLVKEYGETPEVLASESHLGQAILSLLVHAVMSIPEGAPADHEIRVRTATDESGRAVVTVRDDGPAPDRRQLERDFGLAVCRRIVEDLGGEVDISPGVRTILLAPATGVPLPAGSGPQAVQAPRKRARVLVIDDEEAVGKVLARGLSRHHDVLTVTTAGEALARLETGDPIDVIVCDLNMPDVSGMDLYRRIAKTNPELARRMVFLTGGAYTRASREFLDKISNPRVEKPFELANVLAIIAGLVR